MADVISGHSNHIGFSLKAPGAPTLLMNNEPDGWEDDNLELIRQKDYDGIFTQFTGALRFYGDAFDYILNAYEIHGINADVFLTKNVLREKDGEVKFVQEYIAIADLKKLSIDGNYLSVHFNSNFLAEILKSHETDEFELERLDSIDGDVLPELQIDTTEIKGRDIYGTGESKMINVSGTAGLPLQRLEFLRIQTGGQYMTVKSELVTRGNPRHSPIDLNGLTFVDSGFDSFNPDRVSNMFFVDTVGSNEDTYIEVEWDIDLSFISEQNLSSYGGLRLKYYIGKWNLSTEVYDVIDTITIFDEVSSDTAKARNIKGKINKVLAFDEGILLAYEYTGNAPTGISDYLYVNVYKQKLKINTRSFYESSPDISCLFVDKAVDRLLQIITGKKNILVSKYFGRIEDGYAEDGDAGMTALISGFWYRAFRKDSERYKSPSISYKKMLDSLDSVFNIGMGINYSNFEEQIRIEPKKYFYRDRVVVKLGQLGKIKRKLDPKLFFSGLEFGYEDGGDYENEIGLDEPNTKTRRVTPIRKSTEKYVKISKIRADEYGAEKLRRFPEELHPDEDTAQDSGIWYNDLKRTDGPNYTQKDWPDRLVSEPTGVLSPETFRSFFFTPLRMMMRHGWMLRAGMKPYYNRFIRYISSNANSSLETHFTGEDEPLREDADIKVKILDESGITPWTLTGEYSVDDELWNLITGTTSVLVGGSYEDIPNYYFKFEWTNEKGLTERGHLLEVKGKGTVSLKFQIADETILTL